MPNKGMMLELTDTGIGPHQKQAGDTASGGAALGPAQQQFYLSDLARQGFVE
jgi:hypothetical protein